MMRFTLSPSSLFIPIIRTIIVTSMYVDISKNNQNYLFLSGHWVISNFFPQLWQALSARLRIYCIPSRELRPLHTHIPKKVEFPEYDAKTSDSVTRVLKSWSVWSTLSFPFLASQLWFGLVVPVRIPSMGRIDLSKDYSYSRGPCAKKKTLLKKQLHKKYKYKHTINEIPKPLDIK